MRALRTTGLGGLIAVAVAVGGGGLLGAGAARAADGQCSKDDPSSCKVASGGNSRSVKKIGDGDRQLKSIGRRKGTCYSGTWDRYGKSAAGIRQWTWNLEIDYCVRRGRITYLDAQPRPEVNFVIWQYVRQVAYRRSGTVGDRSATFYAQGEFKLCIGPGGVGCVQDSLPYVRVVINGDGTTTYRAGG